MLKRDIGQFLSKIGVNYYATGTLDHKLENGKTVKVYDFFKTDKLTIEQQNMIRAQIKDCCFKLSVSQYAPEQRKALICIPKKAFYTYNMTGF
jgi:hypothetical protein